MPLKVAIIGRPNVGKSTLFNRLAGRKLAIVHDKPGVTRDRKETEARLQDMKLLIIDTAGYEYSNEDNLERRMWEQTQKAISAADVCLFLYDARDGLQPYDEHLADILRKAHKPVVLLANKCEGAMQENSRFEAYKLGLGEPIAFSAEHGLGMLDLYEALKKYYKPEDDRQSETYPFPIGNANELQENGSKSICSCIDEAHDPSSSNNNVDLITFCAVTIPTCVINNATIISLFIFNNLFVVVTT